VGDRTELALGAKIAVSVSVCDLLLLWQGSQVPVGLSDGCQEVQRVLAGAAARMSELTVGVGVDLTMSSAGWAADVGGGGGRVEYCFAVVDDEGVQALAVNDVVARACDAAGNLGDGIEVDVFKAQDALIIWTWL